LFAASTRAGKRLSVKDGLYQNRWAREIAGALTAPVLCQFLSVWELLRNVTLDPLLSDRFVWKWSSDGKYSASSAYRAFFAGSSELLGARELWQTKAPPRVKFLFWLALHRRLWTAERRKRHGLQDDDACVFCSQEPETSDHLFVGCVQVRQLWFALLAPLGLEAIVPGSSDKLVNWWLRSRDVLSVETRPAFDSVLLLTSWCVWKERNSRTFNRVAIGLQDLLLAVFREAKDWIDAGFSHLAAAVNAWSQGRAPV
jgi:hypothetical protein